MPAKSEKQRRFMGAELARKRAGEGAVTNMSESELEDFASKSISFIDKYIDKATGEQGFIQRGQSEGGKYPRIRGNSLKIDRLRKPSNRRIQPKTQETVSTEGSAKNKLANALARGIKEREQEELRNPTRQIPREVLAQEGIREAVTPANVLNEQETMYRRRKKPVRGSRKLYTREMQPYSRERRGSVPTNAEKLEAEAVTNFEDIPEFSFPTAELNAAQKKEMQETAEADRQLMDSTIKAFNSYIDILEKGPAISRSERLSPWEEGITKPLMDTAERAGAATQRGMEAVERGVQSAGRGVQSAGRAVEAHVAPRFDRASREEMARRVGETEPIKTFREKGAVGVAQETGAAAKRGGQAAASGKRAVEDAVHTGRKKVKSGIGRAATGLLRGKKGLAERNAATANKERRKAGFERVLGLKKSSEQISTKDLLPKQDTQGNYIPNESIPFTPDVGEMLSLAADAIETHLIKDDVRGNQSTKYGRRNAKKETKRRGHKAMTGGTGTRDQHNKRIRDAKAVENKRQEGQ